jgi:hypothetical protein
MVSSAPDSPATASDWSLGGNEGPNTELLVLTREECLLHNEVIGTVGFPTSPSSIIIDGRGHGARINVKDYKHPGRKK